MKSRTLLYHEVHPLQLNVFLLFYVYVFFILTIANILPVLQLTYFLFLIFGIIGICILLVRYKYHISIKEKTIALSITVPFKIVLLNLKIKEIKTIEEIKADPPNYTSNRKTQFKPNYTAYSFTSGTGIKLTMNTGKIFIVSSTQADQIIRYINALKNKEEL